MIVCSVQPYLVYSLHKPLASLHKIDTHLIVCFYGLDIVTAVAEILGDRGPTASLNDHFEVVFLMYQIADAITGS